VVVEHRRVAAALGVQVRRHEVPLGLRPAVALGPGLAEVAREAADHVRPLAPVAHEPDPDGLAGEQLDLALELPPAGVPAAHGDPVPIRRGHLEVDRLVLAAADEVVGRPLAELRMERRLRTHGTAESGRRRSGRRDGEDGEDGGGERDDASPHGCGTVATSIS
jgi:hypothetical protein